ncbi:MAG: hypothetical protein L6Q40_06125 [Azonexus sp.]|nr:hypothetical protein [Azonexus sp.]
MKSSLRFARWVGVLAIAMSGSAFAGGLAPQVVAKNGGCPSGYSSSGNYCKPSATAKFAIPRVGTCPSGYGSSGNYCLASSNARMAMAKQGSCPSGYGSSGAYCLKGR